MSFPLWHVMSEQHPVLLKRFCTWRQYDSKMSSAEYFGGFRKQIDHFYITWPDFDISSKHLKLCSQSRGVFITWRSGCLKGPLINRRHKRNTGATCWLKSADLFSISDVLLRLSFNVFIWTSTWYLRLVRCISQKCLNYRCLTPGVAGQVKIYIISKW